MVGDGSIFIHLRHNAIGMTMKPINVSTSDSSIQMIQSRTAAIMINVLLAVRVGLRSLRHNGLQKR